MPDDREGPAEGRPEPDLFERLTNASPDERGAIVLGRIEADADSRFILPVRDGMAAMLDGADLVGARLREADLRGARMRKAVLRGADLRRADLRGCLLGGADLKDARLEEADLRRADLAGADLRRAVVGKADLRECLLEEADLREAGMRFVNLQGAALEHADLRGADLWGADLGGAVLTGADLRAAILKESSLRGADFTGANFEGAVMSKADLTGATLKDAMLQGLVLTSCDVAGVRLAGAWLERTRLRREQIGDALGEELDGDHAGAAQGYLTLERNFVGLGDSDAASWAYRKRRRMQKLAARRLAGSAIKARRWADAVTPTVQYLADQFVEWLCDYGESIPRVLASLVVIHLVFMAVYGLTGSVERVIETAAGPVKTPTGRLIDLATFSLLAMTTGNTDSSLSPRHNLALVLVAVEVFLSVAVIGLLGFVLGNRIRR